MHSNYNTDFLATLSNNSRVWVYQCNRALTDSELSAIATPLKAFISEWSSHSREVIASGSIVYNRFLILAADESKFAVSGCSIDSSVHFIKELGQQLNVDFFDRMSIAYKDGDTVKVVPRKEFGALLANNTLNEDTIVFNNMVTTKETLLSAWEVSLKESWHAKAFGVA